MIKKHPIAALAVCIALFFVVCIEASKLSPSYKVCDADQQDSRAEYQQYDFFENTSSFFYCEGVYAEANNGSITATATVLLAFLTGILGYLAWDQRKTSKAQLRPYVMIKCAIISGLEIGERPVVKVTLRNFGATPAIDMMQWSQMGGDAFPASQPFPKNERLGKELPKTALAPSGEFIVTPSNTVFPPITAPYRLGLESGEGAVYVVGCVKYRDTFGDDHTTEYILFDGGPTGIGGEMSPYRTGNTIT